MDLAWHCKGLKQGLKQWSTCSLCTQACLQEGQQSPPAALHLSPPKPGAQPALSTSRQLSQHPVHQKQVVKQPQLTPPRVKPHVPPLLTGRKRERAAPSSALSNATASWHSTCHGWTPCKVSPLLAAPISPLDAHSPAEEHSSRQSPLPTAVCPPPYAHPLPPSHTHTPMHTLSFVFF